MYAQRLGYKMLVLHYKYLDDAYDSADATRLASHMFKYLPVDISRQGTPESIIWVSRADGTLCSFRYDRDEEIAAWSRIVTGDVSASPTHAILSSAVVAGTQEDRIWTQVERYVDGEFRYYIERFSNRTFTSLTEGNYLDSIRTRTADSLGRLTRLYGLEGHTTTVMQGATKIGTYTVQDGMITGLTANQTYTVGLPYSAHLKTMQFAVPGAVVEGNIKRITNILIRYVQTEGGQVGAISHGQNNLVDLDASFSLSSDDIEVFSGGGFDKDGRLALYFTEPYPATILAVVFEIEIIA